MGLIALGGSIGPRVGGFNATWRARIEILLSLSLLSSAVDCGTRTSTGGAISFPLFDALMGTAGTVMRRLLGAGWSTSTASNVASGLVFTFAARSMIFGPDTAG